ncbi:hypothetical protein L7F22_060879 [Adiantum nelumboides]|nr:hypothetical protein [Adiantum nelumboides]
MFLVSKGLWNIVQGINVLPGYVDTGSVEDVAGSSTRAGVVCSTAAAVCAVLSTVEQIRCDNRDGQAYAVIALFIKRNITPHIRSVKPTRQTWDILAREVFSDHSLVQSVLDALPESTFASTWRLVTEDKLDAARYDILVSKLLQLEVQSRQNRARQCAVDEAFVAAQQRRSGKNVNSSNSSSTSKAIAVTSFTGSNNKSEKTDDKGKKKMSLNLKKHRPRLDELCLERFPQHSRTLIQSWILQGKVLVDGQPVLKAGVRLSQKSEVKIIAEVPKYVCRAGYKLEAAIAHFKCDISEKVVLDAGLSTGGFTDCLLQSGAACVYGVDVGYGQVADKIRTDKRVHVLERTNLRHLSSLPQPVDIATLDLSFISILTVMPAVSALMKESSILLTLIKPQFEAQRSQVGSGGIVRDPAVHKEVLKKVVTGVESRGFRCEGWIESPLKGADGNIEFLACFKRGAPLLLSDLSTPFCS